MRNSRGTSAAVLTLGANLHSVRAPGRDGFDQITLAFDDVAGYLAPGGPYFGAIAGRVANRIAGGVVYPGRRRTTGWPAITAAYTCTVGRWASTGASGTPPPMKGTARTALRCAT